MLPDLRSLRRWWRSKGHGVHSPFAFRFIINVLRGDGRYYGYILMESRGKRDMLSSREIGIHKLLFRLICEFEPAQVYAPCLSATGRSAILTADSRISFTNSPCSFNIIGSASASTYIPGEGTTVVMDIHAGDWKGFKNKMREGMTFCDDHMGVAVHRHDLPRQDFEINFR